MSIWRIIFANLKFSKWQHLGTCLGVALSSMILIGALTIGDSIRGTLLKKSEERIGSITHLIVSQDGYFHSNLSDRLQAEFTDDGETAFAPILMTSGTFSSPDGKTRASGLTVLGIDAGFFEFSEVRKNIPDFSKQGFWASPDLAKELEAVSGSRMILRVEEPSLFSRDAPLSGERDAKFVSWNRPYLGELSSELLGKFSLRSNMEPVRTIFAPLSMLQSDMFIQFDQDEEKNDFANLVLAKISGDKTKKLENELDRVWELKDGGLLIKKLTEENSWALRSRGVFLNDRIAEAAKQAEPEVCGEFTYLVNAIRKAGSTHEEDRSLTPYSMVTGIDIKRTSLFPDGFQNDQIAVNQWLARDLNLSLGDEISLEYYIVGPRRKLMEANRTFHVRTILPMPSKIAKDEESDWTPRFPGLSDSENCGEWDTGIPIKNEIRPKDEEYWDEYRGSPKAFITHQAAQEMWGNRWGSYTGFRISGSEKAELLGDKLSSELLPSDYGVELVDFRTEALAAADASVDFGQLFLAFGFFAILAGLALSSLLFGFSLEQRNNQVGMLLALGYRLPVVKVITFTEVGIVSLLGSIVGVGWSWFLGHGILWMLGKSWSGAVSQLDISYLPSTSSVLLGLGAVASISFVTLIWISRRVFQKSPIELMQTGQFTKHLSNFEQNHSWPNANHKFEMIVWGCVLFLMFGVWKMELPISPSFFGVGGLVLLAGLLRYWRCSSRVALSKINPYNLLRRLETHPVRKITVIGILAVGTFLVIGAGAFRQNPNEHNFAKRSGTGGFSDIIKTTLPIYDDLLSEEAAALFDLNQSLLTGTKIIPVRKFDGDDANCLNLHQSTRPPLYGVFSKDLFGRFEFAEGNWSVIEQIYPDGILPAVVDQNTMLWSLKKKLGDRILYTDELGNDFEVVIAGVLKGSFLQGGLYLSEKNWLKKYPGTGGFREFWISSNGNKLSTDHLEDRLFNYGVQSQTTANKLAAFKEVENTYLSIFQVLGGIGVILGSLGLFIVILRNLWERSSELATLHAIGFSPSQLRKIFHSENLQIVYWGWWIGVGAGFIGLLPSFVVSEKNLSWINLLGFGFSLALVAYLSTVLAVHFGLKGTFLYKLRDE
jgi:putative ABC transport system permease protein